MPPILLFLLFLLPPTLSIRPYLLSLHAQAPPTPTLIVGSILTTSGLSTASQSNPNVTYTNATYYPFHYSSLSDTCHDVVIIEGYFAMVASFINEVRRIDRINKRKGVCPPTHYPVRIMFWSLDPDFPEPSVLSKLDFDGILTNSMTVMKEFDGRGVVTGFNELAVDGGYFKEKEYDDGKEMRKDIVFVGSGGAILSGSKMYLKELLETVIETVNGIADDDVAVSIYGSSWEAFPEFQDYYKGVLTKDELPLVYSSALLVLGSTMDAQRDADMVNNRVYEVLASGSLLLTERFKGVEGVCDGVCLYYDIVEGEGRVDGVEEGVRVAVGMEWEEKKRRGREGRRRVEADHGYESRLKVFVDTVKRIEEGDGKHRMGMGKVLFITDEMGWWDWGGWGSLEWIGKDYQVEVVGIEEVFEGSTEEVKVEGRFKDFAFVIGVGSVGGDVDTYLRQPSNRWPDDLVLPNSQPQYRGFVVIGSADGAGTWEEGDFEAYDVLFVGSEEERGKVEAFKASIRAGTHVVLEAGVGVEGMMEDVGRVEVEKFVVGWRGEGWGRLKVMDQGVCEGSEGEEGTRYIVLMRAGWDGEIRGNEGESNDCVSLRSSSSVTHVTPAEEWKLYLAIVSTPYVDISLSSLESSRVEAGMAFFSDSSVITNSVYGKLGVTVWTSDSLHGKSERKDAMARDLIDRGEMIMEGITRAMCLGRSRVRLHVNVWGVSEGTASGSVVFSVDTRGWVGGRDGGWCLFINDGLVTCVHQEGLGLRVGFGHTGRVDTLRVELRGNVYDDVVRVWEGVGFEVVDRNEKEGGKEGIEEGGWKGRIVDVDGGKFLN